MATVQHLVIANRKRRPIICIIKLELNKTFKETTKATEVAQVKISLMAGGHKIIMHILVPLTLLLQVLLKESNRLVIQLKLMNNFQENQAYTFFV